MAKRTAAERFWPKVNKQPDGGCWLWMGSRISTGYGDFRAGDRHVLAHRFAYELLVGPIPQGKVPDHLCRVPSCVKAVADEFGPAHLEVVTHRENILRGIGPSAIHARQTHCKHGHPFDQVNTYYAKDGRRQCRACHRGRERIRWEARRSGQDR